MKKMCVFLILFIAAGAALFAGPSGVAAAVADGIPDEVYAESPLFFSAVFPAPEIAAPAVVIINKADVFLVVIVLVVSIVIIALQALTFMIVRRLSKQPPGSS
ncbi:MAG: hypothetical protein LBI86_09680 [Treponema sp.]|nr:hypothetical protein [Treponema sp.]